MSLPILQCEVVMMQNSIGSFQDRESKIGPCGADLPCREAARQREIEIKSRGCDCVCETKRTRRNDCARNAEFGYKRLPVRSLCGLGINADSPLNQSGGFGREADFRF